jgi:NADH:ubiquinone oxidoreductase subunit 6 (subunit J)
VIAVLAFYLFATMTIASAGAVIFARNPVNSVLWLILTFFNAAGLMLLVGAEFIALLLVIVYVGAVAVLFLFETAGIILRVALVGAIVLTHRGRKDTRPQDIGKQVRRRPQDATVNTRPDVGQGIEL